MTYRRHSDAIQTPLTEPAMHIAILVLLVLILIFSIFDHWAQATNSQKVLDQQIRVYDELERKFGDLERALRSSMLSGCNYPKPLSDTDFDTP